MPSDAPPAQLPLFSQHTPAPPSLPRAHWQIQGYRVCCGRWDLFGRGNTLVEWHDTKAQAQAALTYHQALPSWGYTFLATVLTPLMPEGDPDGL